MRLNVHAVKPGAMLSFAAACLLAASVAFGQIPPGPPPPGGPGGRPGPGGPGIGPGRGFYPMPMTLINAPLNALDAALKLSDDQREKIAKIRQEIRQQRRSRMPQPGGQPGFPPDSERMRADMERVRAEEEKASRRIEEVLNAEQKRMVPGVMRELDTLRFLGIPPELYGTLKLSGDQKRRLAEIAEKTQQEILRREQAARDSGNFEAMREVPRLHQQAREKAMAVLTAGQREQVEEFRQNNPIPGGPGFGPGGPGFGPGGPGGPGNRRGGPGGPPFGPEDPPQE